IIVTNTDLSEFETLLNKLLEQRSELTRSDIEEKIKQKKEKIGAGYLTDQGALFLIASDLGVSLSEPVKVEMGLKDLYVGAKEISLETRVLNFSPAKQYSRKDGTPFFLRTMTVYDGNATASVKLWDEKANLPGIEDLEPGDLIKIIKAYVKSDLNGSPTINIGSWSNIETVDIDSDIPAIDSITKMIFPGAKSTLFGVRTKTGNQGLEIHGNEATIMRIEGEKEVKPVVTRILSISKNDAGKSMVLCVDTNRNMFKITDLAGKIKLFKEGEIIECMPSKAYGNSIILDDDSFVRKVENENIPSLSDLRTKISDVKIGDDYCIEAIILKKLERREVQTKTGESISLGEMYVEDDTGPISVKGWRNQASLLDKLSIGEVVSVTGLTAKTGLDNKIELFLTPFSTIIKKN